MQKIIPFLWFANKAEEAANFYVALFENSKVGNVMRYDGESAKASGQPEGSVLTVSFTLDGYEIGGLNGGPVFSFTPATSFFVSCETREEVDTLWQKLVAEGKVLMPLDAYPFSERYGWLEDKFGVSWQLILSDRSQRIVPCLLFVGEQYGNAEEAMNLYTSLFDNSSIPTFTRYGAGEAGTEGTVAHAVFALDGQEFVAMDGPGEHAYTLTPAMSFLVNCATQEEVDKFWDGLSEGGVEDQCGWLKDKYGVSWQIVPSVLNELLSDPDPEKAQRTMHAMLQMHKLDIAELKKAHGG
ncbi:MAG: hypothetical protein A2408_00985 [Candidatus Yonathbacteria bacterium RIFOXYC1_FULL_52_10]|uniref:PhnB-like domain-containing protein n=1 Tax=Candidatus Yonathbacteria bacterium RIFOXYD1_FULL_52_36 TaxID=1802730 RepID=A0A1G2SMY4_9BACT|nr:MAG: hypothetical protein A2408_00985 [Candidatus Yonathbacteria bacterium RIFOXYC1_FULL_52_10]OHA86367.1 MAG: hypothetical protein A2591_02610 [Candidatus Yonathbacteria bacterium RIFOXYD1_FULL_52_36]